jgi:hypothetical protein
MTTVIINLILTKIFQLNSPYLEASGNRIKRFFSRNVIESEIRIISLFKDTSLEYSRTENPCEAGFREYLFTDVH